MDLHEIFEKHEDEYGAFDRVENPRSRRPDLHAFLLLDEIAPPDADKPHVLADMVSAAEHDEIYLDTDVELLAERATEGQVIELIRCGVRYSSDFDCLCMFV